MKAKTSVVVACVALAATLSACKSKAHKTPKARSTTAQTAPKSPDAYPSPMKEKPVTEVAVAALESKSGSKVTGTVTFTQTGGGTVKVTADIKGLAPGKHGFHIHENGDCSGKDAKAAGGHFNPTRVKHGGPNAAVHHIGDLGNITAGANHEAKVSATFDFLSLQGVNSIVGRSVIVHERADDLHSQPSGNAGARIACGVIKLKAGGGTGGTGDSGGDADDKGAADKAGAEKPDMKAKVKMKMINARGARK